MTLSERLQQLRESNERLRRLLIRLNMRELENHALTPAMLADLKWLAKDDDDARLGGCSGDWTK